MTQPEEIDEVMRGSYRTNKINERVYGGIKKAVGDFEQFMLDVCNDIDVDVMPGQHDFSGSFMPQQPLNTCLFPQLVSAKVSSLNLVTNPHQFKFNGLELLGISGQNIEDMRRMRLEQSQIETVMHCLEMRHLCPTAPDTLRIHPFKDSDPFVISEKELSLPEDKEMEGAHKKEHERDNTTVPHVFFVGNMDKYESRMLRKDKQFLKVFTVPTFSSSYSMVLLDTETCETYEVKFAPRKEESDSDMDDDIGTPQSKSVDASMDDN